MRTVIGSSPPIDLSFLVDFNPSIEGEERCVLIDIEYGGNDYKGKSPFEIEKETRLGVSMSRAELNQFNSTVNEIYEGFFEFWVKSVSLNMSILVLTIMVMDGEIWRVGGTDAEKFMQQNGLAFSSNGRS